MAGAPRGAGDGQRDGEIGPRLVDAHAAHDVDEDVAGAEADAGVAPQDGEHERQPVAVDAVADPARGHELALGDERLDLDQERTRALHRREDDRAGRLRGLADEARAGVEDLDEAALAHLEDPDLVRRAEAVLQRAQRAVGALALALELQHAVDQVLEHPRAGQRALLGDVPDEQHGRALALGHGADARSPPRAPGPTVPGARLERAASAASAPSRSRRHRAARPRARPARRRGRSRPARGPRARRAPGARRAGGSARPTPRRRRRAWCARAAARWPRAMFVSVDLPMPGEPPSSTSEPGTRPPPRTMSSSPMAVLRRGARSALTSRSGTGARAGPAARAARARAAGSALFDQRVPLAARRALAVPFRRLRAARGAGEHGGRLGHLRSLGAGAVESAPAACARVVVRLRWWRGAALQQHHRGEGRCAGSGRGSSSSGAVSWGCDRACFATPCTEAGRSNVGRPPSTGGRDRRSTARGSRRCCETRAKCAGTPRRKPPTRTEPLAPRPPLAPFPR